MISIYKRELKSYFDSLIGPVIIAFLLAFEGILISTYNINAGYSNFEYAYDGMGFCYILMVPLLTMNIWAGEHRARTLPMLLSSPVPVFRLVVGKYLAVISLLLLPTIVTCFYPLVLSMYGKVNFAAVYGSICAFYFLGCSLLAIGTFISTLTDKPFLSALMCFGVLVFIYLMTAITGALPSSNLLSMLILTVSVILITLVIHIGTRSWKIGFLCGFFLICILLVLFFLKPEVLSIFLVNTLKEFDLFKKQRIFTNGIFDLSVILQYASISIVLIICSTVSIEKYQRG